MPDAPPGRPTLAVERLVAADWTARGGAAFVLSF